MSWDIFAWDLPQDLKSVRELPHDFKPKSFGSRSSVISRIKEIFPNADFPDPSWGLIDGSSWSIEVSLGKDQDCDSLTLHVRGEDAAVNAVASIVDALGLRAIDAQTGEFFAAGPEALESFRAWRAYRDQIVASGKS